jgi:hypothetical protein
LSPLLGPLNARMNPIPAFSLPRAARLAIH